MITLVHTMYRILASYNIPVIPTIITSLLTRLPLVKPLVFSLAACMETYIVTRDMDPSFANSQFIYDIYIRTWLLPEA